MDWGGTDGHEGDASSEYGDVAALLWLEHNLAANSGEWTGELIVRLLELVDDDGVIAKSGLRESLARVLKPALDLHGHLAKRDACHEIADLLGKLREDMQTRAYEHVPRHEQTVPKKLAKIVLMQSDTNMLRAELAIREHAERYAPPKPHPDADLARGSGEYTNN